MMVNHHAALHNAYQANRKQSKSEMKASKVARDRANSASKTAESNIDNNFLQVPKQKDSLLTTR